MKVFTIPLSLLEIENPFSIHQASKRWDYDENFHELFNQIVPDN